MKEKLKDSPPPQFQLHPVCEWSRLYQIADMAIVTDSYQASGVVYELVTEDMTMTYIRFNEKLRKFDQMRLVEISHLNQR